MARTDRMFEGGGAPGSGYRGRLGVSVRSTEVDPGTRRMVNQQNKAAESYKVKDLDKMEANKARYQEQKMRAAEKLAEAKKNAALKGAAVGAAAGAAAEYVVSKGTQKDHAVTSVDRKTGKANK